MLLKLIQNTGFYKGNISEFHSYKPIHTLDEPTHICESDQDCSNHFNYCTNINTKEHKLKIYRHITSGITSHEDGLLESLFPNST